MPAAMMPTMVAAWAIIIVVDDLWRWWGRPPMVTRRPPLAVVLACRPPLPMGAVRLMIGLVVADMLWRTNG